MTGYILSYIDPDDNEYALNDGTHAILKANGLRGFGQLRAEDVQERVPYTDGVELSGNEPYTGPREMGVALQVLGDSYSIWVAQKQALIHNASPYKSNGALGKLKIVTPNSLTRYIDCRLVEFPDPEMDGPFAGLCIPTFYAPYPHFYDPTAQTTVLTVSGDGGVTFPITFPITFSSADVDETIVVENTGDVPTWPTIRVYGPGDNPSFENTTIGKTMSLTKTMDAGDYLDIDMEAGTINFYDDSAGATTPALTSMDATAEFWALAVGTNTIEVDIANVGNGSAVFTYYLRYLAV